MILLTGGTGTLGVHTVRLLHVRGLPVRILTRHPEHARKLLGDGVEIAIADARDPASLEPVVAGATTVISAMTGFPGFGGESPRTVDWEGNRNLIHVAQRAGVHRFILVSIHGAAPDHPMDLMRMKYRAEQALRASGLAWTIVRPTPFMESWCRVVGDPILKGKKGTIFGRGENPVNFVSVHDVARWIELAITDPTLRGAVLEVGGPENLSLSQFVRTFRAVTGKSGLDRHVPLAMVRFMSVLMRPVKPSLARLAKAAVVMDTMDMSFDLAKTLPHNLPILPAPLAEVVKRDYVNGG